eukprot:gb/GEZN01000788.1/.p1 GENE.gb/GEZN01000788.1/~~gb/GEZN01000788.1/.p1  ORF type:complete len:1042 (+),score=139.30 gb/GEZN01000788.1/:175-3300(+)
MASDQNDLPQPLLEPPNPMGLPEGDDHPHSLTSVVIRQMQHVALSSPHPSVSSSQSSISSFINLSPTFERDGPPDEEGFVDALNLIHGGRYSNSKNVAFLQDILLPVMGTERPPLKELSVTHFADHNTGSGFSASLKKPWKPEDFSVKEIVSTSPTKLSFAQPRGQNQELAERNLPPQPQLQATSATRVCQPTSRSPGHSSSEKGMDTRSSPPLDRTLARSLFLSDESSPTHSACRELDLGIRAKSVAQNTVGSLSAQGSESAQYATQQNSSSIADLHSVENPLEPSPSLSPPKHGRNSPPGGSGQNAHNPGGPIKKFRSNSGDFADPAAFSSSSMDTSDDMGILPTVAGDFLQRGISDPLAPPASLFSFSSSVFSSSLSSLQRAESESQFQSGLRSESTPRLAQLSLQPRQTARRSGSHQQQRQASTQDIGAEAEAKLAPSFIRSRTQPAHLNSLEPVAPVLPSIPRGAAEPIKRVSADTIAAVLRGEYSEQLQRVYILDCRYEYEYAGGHIIGAIHMDSRERLEHFLEEKLRESSPTCKLGIVFHCEFSSNRAPFASRIFRELDRQAHEYPQLGFPEVVILEGGYREFFKSFPSLCTPQAYVSMWDASFAKECKEEHRKHRRSWGSSKNQGMGTQHRRGGLNRDNDNDGERRQALMRRGSSAYALGRMSRHSRSAASSPGLTPIDMRFDVASQSGFGDSAEENVSISVRESLAQSGRPSSRKLHRDSCASPSSRQLFSPDFMRQDLHESAPVIQSDERSPILDVVTPSADVVMQFFVPNATTPPPMLDTFAYLPSHRHNRSQPAVAATALVSSQRLGVGLGLGKRDRDKKEQQRLRERLSGRRAEALRVSQSTSDLSPVFAGNRCNPSSLPSSMPASPSFCRPPDASVQAAHDSADSLSVSSSPRCEPSRSSPHTRPLLINVKSSPSSGNSSMSTELSPLGERSARIPARRASFVFVSSASPVATLSPSRLTDVSDLLLLRGGPVLRQAQQQLGASNSNGQLFPSSISPDGPLQSQEEHQQKAIRTPPESSARAQLFSS